MKGSRQRWARAEEAVLRARYPHEPTTRIARAVGRSVKAVYQRARALGLRKTDEYLASPAAGRTNGRQGMGTRFQKGHTPANKGLRRPGWGPGRMKDTQFKRGERRGLAALNWCPVGTIKTDSDGYQRIKVREAHAGEACGFGNVRVWPLLNRHVWEQAHGPIPPGYVVIFKDGDKANCALDNLALVSRADLMRSNSVHNYPKPLTAAIQLLGALRRQIRERTEHHASQEQDRRPA